MITNIYKIFFLLIIFLYQTSVLSKTTDEKDFNPKYLSNYLSAKISYSNQNNEDSVKYFNSSKSIINKHEGYLKEYVFALVLNGEIQKAINQIKLNKGLISSDFFEADLLLGLDSFIKKDYENSKKYFEHNNINQPNRNRLLWRDKSVDGLKTGHTEAAGFCLVASAKRNDMRLISVVMGTKSENARAKETQKLLNYGFRYYQTHTLYTAGQSLSENQVWSGSLDLVQLGLAKEVIVTIPRGHKSELEAEISVNDVIQAPVNVGEEFGRLIVKLDGEIIVDEPLVALEPVPEGGFFKRLWDMIKLFFIGLFA